MKFAILLTNDYEVLGNGRGNVQSLVVDPTARMLDLLDRYGAKITLFVDVVEYWRFREAEDSNWFSSSYQSASLIEQQLRSVIERGHDVQLHVHPQWLYARPEDEERWNVDNRYWRTPMVPKGLGSHQDPLSLVGMLHKGKKTLEGLLKPVRADYECVAFRAGGYCIQPESDVLEAMRKVGLGLDSSVCPGRKKDRHPAYFDFKKAPLDLPYWKMEHRVTESSPEGDLIELPVATCRQSRHGNPGVRNRRWVSHLRRWLIPQIVNLDYCKLPASELISLTEKYMKRMSLSGYANEYIPIVLIGHSKEWRQSVALESFVQWCPSADECEFMHVSDWVMTLSKGMNGRMSLS